MTIYKKFRINGKLAAFLVAAVLIIATFSGWQKTSALGSMTNLWAVETNMDASGSGQLWLAFKTATAGTPGTITVALSGTGASVATTNGNLSPTTTGCTTTFGFLAGVTALPGTLNATGSGATISLTGASSLSASTSYCVAFSGASAVTNPSSAGVYSYTVTDTQDTGTEYYSVLTAGTNNTISVTATVPQSFTLSLSGNTDAIGTLTASNPTTSTGITATVSTNATNGLGLWAYDTNTGLHSANASHTLASTSPGSGSLQTLSNGAEGYVTNVAYLSDSAGTAPTTTTPFTSGTAYTGDGLNTTPAEIASGTAPVSAAQLKIKESAEMSNITPEATDYSDSVTIVGAGSF